MRVCVSTDQRSGVASAAYAARAGHQVRLHIPAAADDEVRSLYGRTSIAVDGVTGEGNATFDLITKDLAEALDRADVLVVVGEPHIQRAVAETARTRLGPEVPVLLAPGLFGGAITFSEQLRGTPMDGAIVAETNGMMHLATLHSPERITIKAVKRRLPVAGFPGARASAAVAKLATVFPDLDPVDNVLITGLANTNAIVHPAVSLLNAGVIETRGGDFPFFTQAMSDGVGRVMEAVDRERVQLLRDLGLPPTTGIEWFTRFYQDQHMRGSSLREMLGTFTPWLPVLSPDSVKHRYFTEDIPFGIVPIASLAQHLGRPTPTIESIIALASLASDEDFFETGRTVEAMGWSALSRDEILRFVREG